MSSHYLPEGHIAAIGDAELVSVLRLAGVSRYYMIRNGPNAHDDVRKALIDLINRPNVGIVVIQENYAEYVEDLVAQVRKGRGMTPVIIEVPSKFGTKYPDVREYYKAFIRESIGFEVEI
jgi:vacuolar-type H+-ATPase subunit F/Vma7